MVRALDHLLPPPDVLPSDWAEQNIMIPVGNAAPGPMRFDAAAYQRGMLNCITEPGIERITYMMGAQLGKTVLQQCITAYFIGHDPRSQIWMMPTENDVQTFRSTKLDPMLQANRSIRDRMAKPRGREGQNNSRLISFVGGWLLFSWGGSLTTLRGRSAPVTLADEIDGLPRPADSEKDEGDQVELLRQRAASFSSTGQVLHVEASTPTVKGHSRIEKAHDQGDCRKFWIPCQHCGERQVLKWENVTWTGRQLDAQGQPDHEADAKFDDHDPDTAAYVCAHCGALWDDADRKASVRAGEWIASRPTRGHASFHLSELYSPFRFLRDVVKSYLAKIKSDSYNTFVNVSLALTHEEASVSVDPTGLVARAETYAADAPMGVLYITAGIDMQMDRLECEFVGWGDSEESWSLGYHVLWGDPVGGDVWQDLDDLLATEFVHESGMVMRIGAACMDTGGTSGMTQSAYEYLRGKTGRRLFGIKGYAPSFGAPIVEKVQRKQSGKSARKVDLFRVAVDEGKLIHMRRLAVEKPGPGYCHLPADRYDLDEWAKQATAEKLRTDYVKGQPRRYWWKPDKARNEATDCRVYATAALKIVQPSFRRLRERLNAYIATKDGKPAAPPPALKVAPQPATKIPDVAPPKPEPQTARVHRTKAARASRAKNWVTGWK